MRDAGLEQAIKAAGGVASLARGIGIAQPSVSAWSRIPAERVLAVEALRLSDDAGISSAQNVSVETHPSEEAPAAPQQPVRRHGSAKPTV